ncbi:MAG: hypothetical protein ACREEM_48545, partial [Blastocatellia bacterium]
GATIGAIAGTGILAATGIGAAAGVTTSLLLKGKEAVVEEGQRFGLELTSPLRVGPAWYSSPGSSRPGSGSLRPIIPDTGGSTRPILRPRPQPIPDDPNSVRTAAGLVPVYDVRTDRTGDGYLRVLISGETPTNGWRLYTNHQITNNNTLEVRLRGWPPSSSGYRQVSHPSASTIIVQDRGNAISRLVVHGSNGSRTIAINNSGGYYGGGSGPVYTEPYRPPTQQPTEPYRPPRPGDLPSDGSSINLGVPPYGTPGAQNPPSTGGSLPTTTLAGLANRVANELEVFRENFTASIGLFRNSNGTYDILGSRRPTANERQMVDSLNYLIDSARQIAREQDSTQLRRAVTVRLRDDFAAANSLWQRVNASPEMNRRWQTIQQSVQNLLSAAAR